MTRPFRTLLALVIALAFGSGWTLAQGLAVAAPTAGASEQHDDDHDDDHAEDHDDDHDEEHGALEGVRLLVASLDGPELIVLDAADGDVVGRFTVPARGRVYQLPNPQLAGVTHRDANRVGFVHSGLTAIDHGDHMDLVVGSPYVVQTVNLGPQPTHFFAQGNDIAIFNDGDGSMAWLDARLLGVTLDVVSVDGLEPDHGALVVVDGHLIGGGLREAAVRVYDRNATLLATFGGCPGLDGQGTQPMRAAFGCSDGVLLVEAVGGGVFTAHKVANPAGSPEGARVGAIASDAGSPTMVGNFGQGIALIDPAARTLTPIALPAAPAGMRFAEEGEVLVVLTLDGSLHTIDPATGTVLASVEVLEAWAQGEPRPSFTHLGDHAFVLDPKHGAVWVVDLDHLEVVTHHELPFTPGSVAAMAIPGAATH